MKDLLREEEEKEEEENNQCGRKGGRYKEKEQKKNKNFRYIKLPPMENLSLYTVIMYYILKCQNKIIMKKKFGYRFYHSIIERTPFIIIVMMILHNYRDLN